MLLTPIHLHMLEPTFASSVYALDMHRKRASAIAGDMTATAQWSNIYLSGLLGFQIRAL